MLSFASNTTWMSSKALPALHKQGFSFIFTGFCIFKFQREGKKTLKVVKYIQLLGGTKCLIWKTDLANFLGHTEKNTNNLENMCGRWSIYVNQQQQEQLGKALSKSSGEKNNTANMLGEV